jgi:hypothetical protein
VTREVPLRIRSAVRASRRNAHDLAEARLDLVETDLAAYRPSRDPFDVVLAGNVNVFWTGSAEIERLGDLLAEDGVVHLVYDLLDEEPVGPPEWVGQRIRDNFVRHGFGVRVSHPPGVVCFTATRPAT